jgi:hypothetical protein
MTTTQSEALTTDLEPAEAVQFLIGRLTTIGANITATSGNTITGNVTKKELANPIIGFLLLLLMILPGLLWFMFGGRTKIDPFSISLAPRVEGGSWLSYNGTGRGLKAARRAVAQLPS